MTFGRELIVLLKKPSMFGKQNNQLPTKSHDELKDYSTKNASIPFPFQTSFGALWLVFGEILGIIGWDPSVCKSNRLHVDTLRFLYK